jgi:type IV pilus assembly protein PilV
MLSSSMHHSSTHLRVNRSLSKSNGVVLIEALVAILILSFGLLGVAGLQINALAYQKSSWNTHRVAELSIDIAERIRANPVAALAGKYTYSASYATGQSATFTLNNCRATGSTCSAAQIADDDIANWVIKAQNRLPSGSVQLVGDMQNGYELAAIWKDKDSTVAPTTCSGTPTGIEWRTCCPTAVAASDTGVRCIRSVIIP